MRTVKLCSLSSEGTPFLFNGGFKKPRAEKAGLLKSSSPSITVMTNAWKEIGYEE